VKSESAGRFFAFFERFRLSAMIRRTPCDISFDYQKIFIDNSARPQDLLTTNRLKFPVSANRKSKKLQRLSLSILESY
jgi:hypothetical protein